MISRILYSEEKDQYNALINHPVQTWEWGDFQISQGHKVYRLGVFDNKKMVGAYSLSFHTIPKTSLTIGTILRGPAVDEEMLNTVRKIATDEKAVFVKFEPDVYQKIFHPDGQIENLNVSMEYPGLFPSPKVAFYPHTFLVDLTKTETQLLEGMHSKTRYNIKIANRNDVKVIEDNSDSGFETYLDLLFQTTKRQGFYLHNRAYHQQLWQVLKKTGMAHIFIASYQGQPLSSFMLFTLKDKLFYPYGASLPLHREVMAQNLLMWESVKFGQSQNLKTFDMWGCLGPEAREGEQGFGFHRFKQGYGGTLVQYVGTYDFILDRRLYDLYNLVDRYRWKFLRLKAAIFRR